MPQRSPSIRHVTTTPHSPKVTRRISIHFGAVLGCVMELNPRDCFPVTDGGRFCQPSEVTVPFHSRLWPLLCPLTLRCHCGSALCHPRHPKSLPRPSEPVGPSLALSCLAFLKQKGCMLCPPALVPMMITVASCNLLKTLLNIFSLQLNSISF